MLYLLGAVAFEVSPLNTHEVEETEAADFAEKAVLGRRPPLEFVGPGPEQTSMRGTLFPEAMGGLEAYEQLRKAMESGAAQKFTRGDGLNMGWRVITDLRRSSTFLNAQGVGKKIDFEINLKRADPPPADRMLGALADLGAAVE